MRFVRPLAAYFGMSLLLQLAARLPLKHTAADYSLSRVPCRTLRQDMEPEYIAVSANSKRAFVTLQARMS